MSDLRHPHIVEVLHTGEESGLYYLTMDLVTVEDGDPHSLEDLLKDRGRLPEAEVIAAAEQILAALEYAHGKGVIHRDLKPANILVAEDGTLRVTDFGLAKIVGSEYLQSVIERSISLSMAGAVSMGDLETQGGGGGGKKPSSSARALLGTYDYMAPEQKAGGEIIPQTDIYAFGLILYRLLTGEKPEGAYQPPSRFGAHRSWNAIVERCLQRDPKARYPSASALQHEIARIFRRRRTPGLALTALAGIFITGAITVWFYHMPLPAIHRRASEPAVNERTTQGIAVVALDREPAQLEPSADAPEPDSVTAIMPLPDPRLGARARERAGEAEVVVARLTGETGSIAATGLRRQLDSLNARHHSARLALDQGAWEEAIKGFEAVLHTGETIDTLLAKHIQQQEQEAAERAARHAELIQETYEEGRRYADSEEWHKVIEVIDRLRELDPTNEEIEELGARASAGLAPRWRLVTTLNDQPVSAIVTIGATRHTAPVTVPLLEGQSVSASFSSALNGRRYHAAPRTVTATWTGIHEEYIALEPTPAPTPGRNAHVDSLSMDLVWIEPGHFPMGSETGDPDEQPVRTVQINRGFWIAKTEVTQSQFESLTRRNPSTVRGDNLPVDVVSWADAVGFCERLTETEQAGGTLPQGYVFRLPTEAEWEYAAKGGHLARPTRYAGSDRLDDVAWHAGNSGRSALAVGTRQPNELGIHDMSGNVFEWAHDWYQGHYRGLADINPTGPVAGSTRVIRGGSARADSHFARVACRMHDAPHYSGAMLGFRFVLAPSIHLLGSTDPRR